MTGPHPELEPDPFDDEGPMPGQRRRRVLRIVVLVALGALVLPLVLSAYGVAKSAADRACAVFVSAYDPERRRVPHDVRPLRAGGRGWECFAVSENGDVAAARQPRAAPGDAAPARVDDPTSGHGPRSVLGRLGRACVSAGPTSPSPVGSRARSAGEHPLVLRPSGSSTVRASSWPRFTRW